MVERAHCTQTGVNLNAIVFPEWSQDLMRRTERAPKVRMPASRRARTRFGPGRLARPAKELRGCFASSNQ